MTYTERRVARALRPAEGRDLFGKYILDIYEGCEHNCMYCDKQQEHRSLSMENLLGQVFVNTNIPELLDRELSSDDWKGKMIQLGGGFDCYQPCESRYALMPKILRILIKHGNPVSINTHSALILRDIALYDELSRIAVVNVSMTINTHRDRICRTVEPGASLPGDRLETLKEFAKTGVVSGFNAMPLLPYIADDENTLGTLMKWAYTSNVSYMARGVLYLRTGIKSRYLNFIRQDFPKFYEAYLHLYRREATHSVYRRRINDFLDRLQSRYPVNTRYRDLLTGGPGQG